jgi:hypothetical protein
MLLAFSFNKEKEGRGGRKEERKDKKGKERKRRKEDGKEGRKERRKGGRAFYLNNNMHQYASMLVFPPVL